MWRFNPRASGAEQTTCPKRGCIRNAQSLAPCETFLDLLNHAVEVGITPAETSSEPVPAALTNFLSVRDNLKLTGFSTRDDGFNIETLLDEGRETRNLGFVVPSRWAVNNLNLHCVRSLAARCSQAYLILTRVISAEPCAMRLVSTALNGYRNNP